MKEKKIMLPTIAEAKRFVEEATRCDFDIDVFYNRVTIDAKSILGVLSLDLTRVLTVQFNGADERFEEYLDTIFNRIAISGFQVKNLILTGSQLELVASLCEAKKSGAPYEISVKKLTSLYQSLRTATAESIANSFGISEERAALLYTSLSIYTGFLRFCP